VEEVIPPEIEPAEVSEPIEIPEATPEVKKTTKVLKPKAKPVEEPEPTVVD